jgi:hypothetical protein
MSTRCFRVLIGAVAWTVLNAHGRRAAACEPPMCQPEVELPTDSALPVNAVRFRIRNGDGSDLSIVDPSGHPVATTVVASDSGARYLTPAAPLSPNETYAFHYDASCRPLGPDATIPAPEPAVFHFYTLETASAPTTAGQLVLIEAGKNLESNSAFLRLALRLGADLAPYRGLVEYEMHVDGHLLGIYNPNELVTLETPCDQAMTEWQMDTCGRYSMGIPRGSHHVEVSAFVDGLWTFPPVTQDVNLTCPAAAEADAGVADAGVTPQGAGCSVAGTGRAPGGLFGAWVVAIAILLRWRSRRAERTS